MGGREGRRGVPWQRSHVLHALGAPNTKAGSKVRTQESKHFFTLHVVNLWNSARDLEMVTSQYVLKRRLDNFMQVKSIDGCDHDG